MTSRSTALLALLVGALSISGCRCASGDNRRTGDDPGAGGGAQGDPTGEEDPWVAGDLEAQMPADGEPRQGGQIVFQLYTEPPSLNTIVDSDLWATHLTIHHIYETLLGRDPYDDPDYAFGPELAERWEVSDDNKVFTFHLRRGVKFHDGHDFTSRDVIATFDKLADDDVRAAHLRSYTEALERWEALDEHTVRFTWREPYFLALDNPFASVPIHPAHVIADMSGADYNEAATNPLNRHPIGTGPWKFVEWDSNEKIVVARNADYWSRPPYLDRIVFRIVKEEAIGLQLAERGELDVVTRLRSESWDGMDSAALRERYFRSKAFDNNYAWIGWNNARPFFADPQVRRAMTMLVDVPSIISRLQYGLPRPTTCHFYWASRACPDLEPIAYDPPAAAELLEQRGWTDSDGDGIRDKDGVDFEFTFMIPAASEDAARMGTKMKEDMERAGIELNLQRVEWSAFVRRLRDHDFDSCTLLWGDTSPEGDPAQIWGSASIEGGSNYISFRNERVDEIITQARTMFDTEQRDALYRELGEILYAEQPYTWLYTRPRLSLVSRRIRGARESLMFWQYEDFWLAEDEGS